MRNKEKMAARLFAAAVVCLAASTAAAFVQTAASAEAIVCEDEAARETTSVAACAAEPLEEAKLVSAAESLEETESAESAVYYDLPLCAELQDHIRKLCEQNGIETATVMAMINVESRCNPEAVGDGENSFGLMQIQPRWHQARMERLGATDLLDPYQNTLVGVDLLAELMSRGKGELWAVTAYNGGEGAADRMTAEGETSEYARKVLEEKRRLIAAETSAAGAQESPAAAEPMPSEAA